MSTPLKTRIKGLSYERADQLLANPHNYRIHPDIQRTALRASLGELGWIDVVIVNDVTNHVIDGHLRIDEAIALGQQVPVLHVELTEDEEHAALLTLDPLAAMAITDAQIARRLRDLAHTEDATLASVWESLAPGDMAEPPDAFPSFDAGIETEHECPQCGYRWSGSAHPVEGSSARDRSERYAADGPSHHEE